jgi:hypothetical protein
MSKEVEFRVHRADTFERGMTLRIHGEDFRVVRVKSRNTLVLGSCSWWVRVGAWLKSLYYKVL